MEANRWRNVAHIAITRKGALQSEHELTLFLTLAASLRPECVLEIGTNRGGMIWALGQLPYLRRIVTVDAEAQDSAKAAAKDLADIEVALITGNSTSPDTYQEVIDALGDYQPRIVIIDGGHDFKTAASDFGLYGNLVEPGGVVMVHDTQGYPGHPEIQVPVVWENIRAQYRTTELVDRPGGPCGTGLVWMLCRTGCCSSSALPSARWACSRACT
jgi:cephalosporin hydroxylase